MTRISALSRSLSLSFLAFFGAMLVGAQDVQACSCSPGGGIEHAYAGAEHVVRVSIRKEVRRSRQIPGIPSLDGTIRVYRARVKETYKGCLRRGRIIKLYTARDSGLCGAVLDRRRDYVIALPAGERRAFPINACGFIRLAGSLTVDEIEFLDTRHNCCRGRCECVGVEPSPCLSDPCELESCGNATCVANFCGNCRAEFYDADGEPTCTACSDSFDCAPSQSCTDGRCTSEASCEIDDDCSSDAWCRPTESPDQNACTPFVGEGATCGGYTTPWSYERCLPGLDCVTTPPPPGSPPLPDQPGICTTTP